ncbi:MAG TPA: ABC transporter permease [Dehalococcoidia bacterium]|jgi:ABC-2 type transport system permease protein|nr:ABC transporter permease [Dehalococcoidia bacterium]
MNRYLRLEILRGLRDVRYLVMAVFMPVGFYLLFTSLFGAHGERAEGLPQPVELMIAMAAYGAMWAVFSATAPRIAQEREIGWLRQLRLLPLADREVIIARVLAGMIVALPAMLLVCLTAALVHGIRLSPIEWTALLAAMWAATLPLALLGFAIGYLVPADAAYGVVMVLYFGLGALGGLWMPVAILPEALQRIAHALPSNRLADLGWKIAAGQAPAGTSVLVLCGWVVACGLLALVAYRRTAPR